MGEITVIKLTTKELLRLIDLLSYIETSDDPIIREDVSYLLDKLSSQLPNIDYIAREALIASGGGN